MDSQHNLTDLQIELLAERAAQKALEKIYAEVGKNVLRKLAWLVGLVVVGLAVWLSSRGHLRP